MNARKRTVELVVIAAVVSFLLYAYPLTRMLMLPFTYLNTHIHEAMHAFATVLTGGRVAHIEVFGNGGGVTWLSGGIAPVVTAAGYLGASFLGATMLVAASTERTSRTMLMVIAIGLALVQVLWVRNAIGLLTGGFWVLAFAATLKTRGDTVRAVCAFIGIQQNLAAWGSLLTLQQVAGDGSPNDAAIMQQMTGIPAGFWAGLWSLTALGLIGLGLWRIWRSPH